MSTAPVPAGLMGTSIGSVLYGVYLLSFVASTCILLGRCRERHYTSDKVLMSGGVLLFFVLTAGWILDQVNLHQVFIADQDKALAQAVIYNFVGTRRGSLRVLCFVTSALVLDCILVFRLYIVYERRLRAILVPGLSLIGGIVCGVQTVVGFFNDTGQLPTQDSGPYNWMIAAYGFTFGTNVLALGFISFRVLCRNQHVRSLSGRNLKLAVVVLVESAGLYCAANAVVLVMLVARSSLVAGVFIALAPITGISSCLITLRVGLKEWRPNTERWSDTTSILATHSKSGDAAPTAKILPHARERMATTIQPDGGIEVQLVGGFYRAKATSEI